MPIHPRALVVALLFLVADRAVAQQGRVPADTGFVPWTTLTGRPDFTAAARDAVIQYPAMMRYANVEGTVRLRMIVGVDGAPEPKTVRVVASTHDLFTRSVEDSLLRWRLAPPTLRGLAVRAEVSVHVEFLLAEPVDAPVQQTNTITDDSAGVHIVLGWKRVPQIVGLVADSADVREVTLGAMAELLKKLSGIPAGFACVGWDGSERIVPSDAFQRLSAVYPGLKNANQCPPTFHSMVSSPIDPQQKPAPARKEPPVDPVWVSAWYARPWTADLYVIRGSVIQGTAGQNHYCEARRANHTKQWTTTCEYRHSWIS